MPILGSLTGGRGFGQGGGGAVLAPATSPPKDLH